MSALLEMKGITKSFSSNKVLSGVDLSVEAGEVHALLGENGAGKSTLIKILGGIYSKDAGEIFIDGEKADIQNINDARKYGISIIHQELMLSQHLSIAENVFMGREPMKGRFVDRHEEIERTQAFIDKYHLNLHAEQLLEELTIAQQQMVEIIRAVSFGARIIVMDEPTSSLSENEVEILYDMIRILKKENVAIIYISHRMNELYAITEKTTVLRDGEAVGTVNTKETDRNTLIAMMVGRDLSSFYVKNDHVQDEIVLKVEGLSDGHRVKNASFDLRKGEILGVAGLIGAGRSETMQCLFGLTKRHSGTVQFLGKEVNFTSPQQAMDAGVGFVPEDRKATGLFLQSSVAMNITANVIPKFLKNLKLNKNKEQEIIDKTISDMQIKTTDDGQIISRLSGGNQQKVLIGRWLNSVGQLLILDEPTRGVDVKTKAQIYELIDQLAATGLSIILVSSELPEIINMSDRVLVFSNGVTTGILNKGEFTQERIMELATVE